MDGRMKYKILLLASSPAFLIKKQLEQLSGFEDKLILMNNWNNPDTELYVKEFARRGAEAYNCYYNAGIATSWNFGLKRIMQDSDDYIIILSASMILNQDIGHFISFIEEDIMTHNTPGCLYLRNGDKPFHYFGITQRGIQTIGFFDENFWPAYYEDRDYLYRIKLLSLPRDIVIIDTSNLSYAQGNSLAINSDTGLMSLYQYNIVRITDYYQRKWGGPLDKEVYRRPFNDPNAMINSWYIEKPFHHPILNDINFLPSQPIIRY